MNLTRRKSMFLGIIMVVSIFILINMSVYAVGADSWTIKASMSTPRYAHEVTAVDGNIYVIGGSNGTVYLNSVEEYNPVTNIWAVKASMSVPRYAHKIAVVNGKIYAIGGSNLTGHLNSVEEYDPVTNIWLSKASMSIARNFHEVAVVNGKIYVIGGHDGTNNLNSVEEYDPVTNIWSTKASLNIARSQFEVAVVNEKIYVIGGRNGLNYLNSIEEYDPATNTWTTKASMSIGRYKGKVAVINGKLYVIGGYNGSANINTVEEYDPIINLWTEKASLPSARSNHEIAVVNGKIYSIGGYNFLSPEEYNTVTNIWSTKTSMSIARSDHQIVVVDGMIYSIGGISPSSNVLDSVEEYTPANDVPTIPTNLIASSGNAKVDLTWTLVTGANGYKVKRSTTAGGSYEIVASNIGEASYTDTNVTNGVKYYYVISAVNATGESENSNEASAIPKAPTVIGKALLVVTLIDGTEKEYDLSMTDVSAFIEWYDGKATGAGKTYYIFDKKYNKGSFMSRKDYIVFDKIRDFEVMQYE